MNLHPQPARPRRRALRSVIFFAFTATSCDAPTDRPGQIRAFVSIAPQAYFVQRIGGDYVQVDVLVGPGQSHHSYEPTPRQVTALADARVFFRIGVPFEKAVLDKIHASMRDLAIVDTTEGIRLRDDADSCDDGFHGGQASEKDPHTWLDPGLVKTQAQNIANALCQIDPARAAEYRANLLAFQADLDSVNARIASVLAPLRGREFFVFHPAYGYFGDAYGLKQVAVEESGKEPSIKRLELLIDRARRAGVKLIFVQPQFPAAGARAVAEAIGGAVVPLDPMAADYLKNLEHMADEIAAALTRDGLASRIGA